MFMNKYFQRCLVAGVLAACCIFSLAQEKKTAENKSKIESQTQKAQKIDPLALQVLKAATDRIHNSRAYSFHAFISRERLGTNGQVITQFNKSEFTVQQPDKLRINARARGQDVQLIYNQGHATLFTPETKLYSSFLAAATIDSALQGMEQRGIFLPTANFLEPDPYQSLTKALTEAYVIGRMEIDGETVHQLAFTEPHAEWQLWVIGGPNPTIRRLQVIDKDASYHPRTIVDFTDWNFNASPSAELFTFQKPADAVAIGSLKGLKR